MLATPTKSTGFTPAYDGTGPNVLSSTLAANEPNKTRGFEQPQYSYAGTADFTLTNSSLLSVRGGFFDDNYMDTGIPLTNPVEYGTSNIGLPYPIPDELRGGVEHRGRQSGRAVLPLGRGDREPVASRLPDQFPQECRARAGRGSGFS